MGASVLKGSSTTRVSDLITGPCHKVIHMWLSPSPTCEAHKFSGYRALGPPTWWSWQAYKLAYSLARRIGEGRCARSTDGKTEVLKRTMTAPSLVMSIDLNLPLGVTPTYPIGTATVVPILQAGT